MTETEETERTLGFIDNCEKLNAILSEAHEVLAQVVGQCPDGEKIGEPSNTLADQLETGINVALNSAQCLLRQLRSMRFRFSRE